MSLFSAFARRRHSESCRLPGFGGQPGQGDALEPAGADQVRVGGGDDAAADRSRQHEVRVPRRPGRGPAGLVQVAAAGRPRRVGVGQRPAGPVRGPGQPRGQRDAVQLVQVQGAQSGQEPGQHLGLQVARIAAVGGGQAGCGARQPGQRHPGQPDRPGRGPGPGAAHQLGPDLVAGGGADAGVQQQDRQLIQRHQPVRQARRQPPGLQGQRLRSR